MEAAAEGYYCSLLACARRNVVRGIIKVLLMTVDSGAKLKQLLLSFQRDWEFCWS